MTPTIEKLFFSKSDPSDPRLGDWVKQADVKTNGYVALIGYPDDRGIAANGGRPGARTAPQEIRNFFYRLTPDVLSSQTFQIHDCGDVEIGENLLKTHQAALDATSLALASHDRVITLGGGHDFGYPDGAAFVKWCIANKQKPLVINFDAHLDVRPLTKEPHSGTPFFRLLSEFTDLDFIEVGIQPQCNAASHLQWVKARGGKVFLRDEVTHKNFSSQWLTIIEGFKGRPCFLSMDIDVFSSTVAPGCSQSWAWGIAPQDFLNLFHPMSEHLNLKHLGIYEVSPQLDHDNQTSKLAALIAHRWLFAKREQKI